MLSKVAYIVSRPPNLHLNKSGLIKRHVDFLGASVTPELLPGHRESSLKVSGWRSQKMPKQPGYKLSLTTSIRLRVNVFLNQAPRVKGTQVQLGPDCSLPRNSRQMHKMQDKHPHDRTWKYIFLPKFAVMVSDFSLPPTMFCRIELLWI